jgi:sugar phosphate isomerase/epimerase
VQTHAEIPASPLSLGLCYGSLCALDADALVAVAGEAGFTSVMLPPFPESACGTRAEFRALLDRYGIRRVVLDGTMGMLPRCAFARVNGFTVARHLAAAERFCVDCFNVPHYEGDPRATVAEFVDALAPFCESAATLGASVALEFLPGTGIPDIERALRITEQTGAPNLGIALDTWHWARLRATLDDIRALPPGMIKDFQLSDRAADEDTRPDSIQWGRLVPGEGAAPLAEIIRAVQANAPGMSLNAEVFSQELQALAPQLAAARIAQGLRRIIAAI